MYCNDYSLQSIGDRIAEQRRKCNMTQQELADEIGVKREVVAYWERGNRDIKSEHIINLSIALNTSCDYLLRGVDTENIDIAKDTGLGNDAIKMIKTVAYTNKLVALDLNKALNDFVGSGSFVQFIIQLAGCKLSADMLNGAMDKLKNKFIEYEETPPDDLLKYAAEMAISENSTFKLDCMEIMDKKDDLDYQIYRLQNIVKQMADKICLGGKNNGKHQN